MNTCPVSRNFSFCKLIAYSVVFMCCDDMSLDTAAKDVVSTAEDFIPLDR